MKRRPRLRPRMFKLCAFILALAAGGAIINVAVAWGCVYGARTLQRCDVPASALKELQRAVPSQWMMDSSSSYRLYGFGFIVDSVGGSFAKTRTAESDKEPVVRGAISVGLRINPQGATRVVAGWPMRSLEYTGFAGWTPAGPPAAFSTAITIADMKVPYGVVGRGFAINTVFYAAVLCVLFAAPGFIRRRVRRKRGQCPACAYPIGTNPVCTECGSPIQSR